MPQPNVFPKFNHCSTHRNSFNGQGSEGYNGAINQARVNNTLTALITRVLDQTTHSLALMTP